MRAPCWLMVGVLGLGIGQVAHAEEADGLSLPRLQGRVTLGIGFDGRATDSRDSVGKLSSASVLGDYYFGRDVMREGDAGGFRATAGVFIGSQLGLWGGHPSAQMSSNLFIVERHSFSLLALPRAAESTSADTGAMPYVGLGYSGSSLKGGWGFSADLGLMALDPGNAVRLGRAFGGAQSLDDLLREVRLSPLVQVGVSYQF
jgi:hypothetical protein